ncbi:MAG TPA: hypothetical protein IAB72_04115 [Candidatus Onthoplasma faecipullorum]|nr:hypothetical protein [Candidatus Onthoplasma faecipullorum]
MSTILSFVSPWEFLLRYTVITGVIIAIVGTAILFMAKRITMAKRKTDEINKNDKLYITLLIVGLMFVLIGMIIIALPIDATFYNVQA